MKIVQYHNDLRQATALVVKEGRKLLHIIQIEDRGLRVRKVPKTEARYFKDLTYKGKPYPLRRAIRMYKRAAKTFGATPTVKRILREG